MKIDPLSYQSHSTHMILQHNQSSGRIHPLRVRLIYFERFGLNTWTPQLGCIEMHSKSEYSHRGESGFILSIYTELNGYCLSGLRRSCPEIFPLEPHEATWRKSRRRLCWATTCLSHVGSRQRPSRTVGCEFFVFFFVLGFWILRHQ